MLIWDLENNNVQLIGGPGIIVELDESKFAKRKYNQGHAVVNDDWVFGAVERTPERKCFFAVVPNRNAALFLCIH